MKGKELMGLIMIWHRREKGLASRGEIQVRGRMWRSRNSKGPQGPKSPRTGGHLEEGILKGGA